MKLTDEVIVEALKNGRRIRRLSADNTLKYFAEDGLMQKETEDGLPQRRCVAAFFIDDLTAEDWEVVKE